MSAPTSTLRQPLGEALGTGFPKGIGLHGRVAVTFAAAGGILLGGVLVALMTLSGRMSGHGLFFTASGLFVIGAVLGLAHGLVLGFLGRPAGTEPRRAYGDLGRSLLYAVPAVAVAWLATVWVAMTSLAVYLDRVVTWIGVGVAWIAALAFVLAAVRFGARALKNAYVRWPERRPGTALVAASFAALLVALLVDRPELWGLRLRVTETGAVLLAAALAFWVAGPTITLALRLMKQIPAPGLRQAFQLHGKAPGDVGIGLLVGAVLGVLAIPFIGMAPTTAGAAGALLSGLGQAVVDEVLLRLVLLTSVAWLLLRWHRVQKEEAAMAAIATTVVVQLALYAPGIAAIGFPSLAGAAGFALVTVVLPAAAFGVLFWLRGFGSAMVAHVTAVALLALVVAL